MESPALFERSMHESRFADVINLMESFPGTKIGSIMPTIPDDETHSKKTHRRPTAIFLSMGVYGLHIDLRARNIVDSLTNRSLVFRNHRLTRLQRVSAFLFSESHHTGAG